MSIPSLAIVVCVPGPRDRLGDLPDEYEQIAGGLTPHGAPWRIVRLDPARNPDEIPLQGFDAVVFSGSPSSVNDPDPWIAALMAQVRELHARQVPMVGICFGHQLIAKALGGEVGANPDGLIAGPVAVHWHADAPWMQPARQEVILRAMHHDQVLRLPAGAEVIAEAAHCPIGAYRIGEHVLCTQHHPEMPGSHLNAILDILERRPGRLARRSSMPPAPRWRNRPTASW
ncbi:MAG: type 1 glutamine amidotransferase [Burkholderiaceae bacterium]